MSEALGQAKNSPKWKMYFDPSSIRIFRALYYKGGGSLFSPLTRATKLGRVTYLRSTPVPN